jgi:glycosyltransferase involved in cell wall biosynthesis
MQILIIDNDVFNEYDGGLYIYRTTGDFGLELNSMGYEVRFFQTKLIRKSSFHSFNINETTLKVTSAKRYKSKIFTYLISYIIATWTVLKSDFVYIYYPTNYHYLCFICLLLNKKYGLNLRGQQSFNSRLSAFLFKRAHVVCTVSEYFTKYINELGGNAVTQRPMLSDNFFLDEKVRVYPNLKVYKILFVGRLDIEKGLLELLKAISNLLLKGHNVSLDLVGDGGDLGVIESEIQILGLTNIVTLNGSIQNGALLKEFYYRADIFVLPSYHEGFPRVIYEAMLSRVPVVTTIVGGMKTLMKDGYNCIEVYPRSTNDLVDKLEHLINDYSVSKLLCENAFFSVMEFFNFTTMKQSEIINNSLNFSIK